jgi:Caspase domain
MPIRLFTALAALAFLSLGKSLAMAQEIPNATAYSNTIWPPGSIPTNQVMSSNTKYGILTCRGGTSARGSRVCSWRRERTGAARPSLKYVKKPAADKPGSSSIVENSLQTTPPTPVRVALLIGNQAYDTSVGPLKNPHNDVAIVGASLLAQGFEVLPSIRDGGRSAIFQGVRELVRRLNAAAAGSIGFLYYSGHGAADKDTEINYLIPVDAREPGAPAFWDDSIKLDDVFALLNSARDAAKFVVFDACRNELRLPTKDTAKGLMPVAKRQGLFIAFASAPRETASDQGEKSGPYAAALAAELMKPGLDHLNLFQNVKESVLASTGGVQHPWESNGLTRRVYLDRQTKIEVLNAARLSEPAEAWDKVKDSQDLVALEAFAAHYKETFYADLARARIEALHK